MNKDQLISFFEKLRPKKAEVSLDVNTPFILKALLECLPKAELHTFWMVNEIDSQNYTVIPKNFIYWEENYWNENGIMTFPIILKMLHYKILDQKQKIDLKAENFKTIFSLLKYVKKSDPEQTALFYQKLEREMNFNDTILKLIKSASTKPLKEAYGETWGEMLEIEIQKIELSQSIPQSLIPPTPTRI